MPDYSVHVEEGNGQQYMTVMHVRDAQEAMRGLVYRIDPKAEMAKIEILEVLEPESA